MIYRTSFDSPFWRLRTPFERIENMQREMSQLMDLFSDGTERRIGTGVFPAINLSEDKNSYYVRAELPGIKSEDLDLQITNKNLSISGERKIGEEASNAKYHRRERDAGKFSRAINIPEEVDPDRVEAKMVNGVLTITIPKAEKVKPKQISIQ